MYKTSVYLLILFRFLLFSISKPVFILINSYTYCHFAIPPLCIYYVNPIKDINCTKRAIFALLYTVFTLYYLGFLTDPLFRIMIKIMCIVDRLQFYSYFKNHISLNIEKLFLSAPLKIQKRHSSTYENLLEKSPPFLKIL